MATGYLSSHSEIVELDDEYKENHEAMTVDDNPQVVCKDDNAQVVNNANLGPSVDEVNVVHKPTYAHNLESQLKTNTDKIMPATMQYDDTKALVPNYCWRSVVTHDNLKGEPSLADFQGLRKALVEMKSNYLRLLSDKNHLLMLVEIYHDVLAGKEEEVERLTLELEPTQESFNNT